MSAPGNENVAPGEGTSDQSNEQFDYRQGYQQLRPEFTRTTQELSTARQSLSEYEQLFAALQDDELRPQALEALGLELAAGPESAQQDDDEFVDPLEQELAATRAQVEELMAAREQEASTQAQAEADAMRDNFIDRAIGTIAEGKKMEFSEREQEVLGNLAIAMTDPETGVPDVEGAFTAIYGDEGLLETNRSRWIESKRSAFTAPLGTTIPADRKPQTRSDRVNYVDQRLASLE
jgi:hypothetical protein